MRIVNASYEIEREVSLTKKIEKIARVCYKSEDRIGPGTDLEMIKDLMMRKHYAMLEHGSLVFQVDTQSYADVIAYLHKVCRRFLDTVFSGRDVPFDVRLRYTNQCKERCVISGNLRAWREFLDLVWRGDMAVTEGIRLLIHALVDTIPFLMSESELLYFKGWICGEHDVSGMFVRRITDLSELTVSERMVHEDLTVKFVVDRGVTHELVRMRECSFAQESTRYCNYSLGKYNDEITVINPVFWDSGSRERKIWEDGCRAAEAAYMSLVQSGIKPQQARDVLPTSVKAEIYVTANLREWRHVLKLRACDSTGPAHPQMKEVMVPLLEELKEDYGFALGDLIAGKDREALKSN